MPKMLRDTKIGTCLDRADRAITGKNTLPDDRYPGFRFLLFRAFTGHLVVDLTEIPAELVSTVICFPLRTCFLQEEMMMIGRPVLTALAMAFFAGAIASG